MPDLMGRGAAFVKRRLSCPNGSEGAVVYDYPIRHRGTAGKLRITEKAPGESTDPKIKMRLRTKRRNAAGGSFLHRIVHAETTLCRLRACDLHKFELQPHIADQTLPRSGRLTSVGIRRPKILIHRLELALDLRVGNVLVGRLVNDIHDRLNGDELDLCRIESRFAATQGGGFEPHLRRTECRESLQQHHVRGHRAARSSQFWT